MNTEDTLTLEAFTAKMTELRKQFLFTDRLIVEVEARYRAEHDEWKRRAEYRDDQTSLAREEEYLSYMRAKIVFAVEETLQRLRNYGMEGFPPRHLDNLAQAIKGNHAEWRSKLNGVTERLGHGSIFILYGPRGTGKTQLATAAARCLREEKRFGSSYMVLGDLFTKIKGTFKPDSQESEAGILSNLSEAALLVLDECHEISGTEWQGRILTLLIDGRYRDKRDTILITNHTPDAFLASVGPSIADRISECGFFIACDWSSFRRAVRL